MADKPNCLRHRIYQNHHDIKDKILLNAFMLQCLFVLHLHSKLEHDVFNATT